MGKDKKGLRSRASPYVSPEMAEEESPTMDTIKRTNRSVASIDVGELVRGLAYTAGDMRTPASLSWRCTTSLGCVGRAGLARMLGLRHDRPPGVPELCI